MNYDEIVDTIVKEVYKKLEQTNKKNIKGKTAILVGSEGLDETTKAAIEENYNIFSYNEETSEGDLVVISSLSIKSMANLASLTGNNDEENFIIKMLLEGKKVYVLQNGLEYIKYKSTAPRALYNKYLNFEKELRVYGIDIIEFPFNLQNKEFKSEVGCKLEEPSKNTIEESVIEDKISFEIRNKKLISEMDLKKPFKNGMKSVVIDKKSIITPLASDFIRIHNLKVNRV